MASNFLDSARARAAEGISQAPGTRTISMSDFGSTAAEKTVEGALKEAVGDDGVPAGSHDSEGHAEGAEIALDSVGVVVKGILGLPETQGQLVRKAHGEEAAVPVSEFRGGEEFCYLFGAVVGEQPFVNGSVDLVETADFDKDGWDCRRAAGDEFEVTDGREEGCAAAGRVLPAFAGFEAEAVEEAAELVEGVLGCDGLDERNSLDHEYDCIVWSCETLEKCGGSGDEF